MDSSSLETTSRKIKIKRENQRKYWEIKSTKRIQIKVKIEIEKIEIGEGTKRTKGERDQRKIKWGEE